MKKSYLTLLFSFLLSAMYVNAQTAIDVNGANQYLRANIGTTFSNFSVEMDVYPKGGDATYDRIFSLSNQNYVDLAIDGAGTVRFFSNALGLGGWIPITNLPQNTYSHFAIVRESGTVRFFVNGNQVNAIGCNSSPVNFGQFALGTTMGTFSENANVRIDNFRLWNVSRTNAEIAANYQTCLTGSESGLVVLYDFEEGVGTSTADLAPSFGTSTGQFFNGAGWNTGVSCSTPCVAPDVPTVTVADISCPGPQVTLNISGNLNDATQWVIYSGFCGGSIIGSTGTNTFVTGVLAADFFVRGEGGCITTPGSCGIASPGITAYDGDSDGATICTDCDDSDPTIYPGGVDICDGIDNNCDGVIDEGFAMSTFYADLDGDGYGDSSNSIEACASPAGYVTDSTDCNDSDPFSYQGATDVCDGIDNDCDGLIDEDAIIDQTISTSDFSAFCNADTTIELSSSENGVNYYLRNDLNDTIISGPISGTGSAITLPTGSLGASTTFNVLATNESYALEFDGVDDHVIIADDPLLDISGNITIEAWIKPTKVGVGAQNVLSKSSNVQNNGYIFPRSDDGWNNFNAYLYVGGNWQVLSAPYPALGEWHHVAMTYDGSTYRLYLDGAIANQVNISGPIAINTNDLVIGNQTGFSEFYGGSVDEIRVWNTVRTQADIMANMSNCLSGNEAGLVALYSMENGSGTVITDATNSLNGTMQSMDPNLSWINAVPGTSCGGCSSELSQMVTITVDTTIADTTTVTTCDSYFWLQTGQTYTTSGFYSDTIVSTGGCDSIIVLDLTMFSIQDQTVTALDTALCVGNSGTTITLGASEPDILYSLRDSEFDFIVDGPQIGTGGALVFNTGTIDEPVTFNIQGSALVDTVLAGTALEFDGVDDIVMTSPGAYINSVAAPIYSEVRLYLNSLTSNATIFEKPNFWKFWIDTTGALHFTTNGGGYLSDRSLDTSIVKIPIGQWVHLGVFYDYQSTIPYFYINGHFVGASTVGNGYPEEFGVGFTIGGSTTGSGLGGFLDGKIDKLSLWETYQNYNYYGVTDSCLIGNEPNLIAYYDMNDGVGSSVLQDLSPNGSDGTLTNMDPATDWVDGIGCGYCYQEMSDTINITLINPTSGSESITACDSYTWNGTTYNASGSYTATLTNAVGCDSTATLNLTINNTTSGSESITACDSYTWNGTTYTTSGSYTATLTNAVGCDSTATLNLTINNSTSGSESITACDSYTWNGTTYNASGSYTATLTNAKGCDSTATLNLTINNSTSGSESITACDSYTWNGTTYTTSGSYTATLTNAAGCDSTATLNLTINNSTSGSENITACDSYTWNGTTYNASGSYTATLTNAAGCDSTATLNLTINNSTSGSESITACDSYTWNGTTYTTSGSYAVTLTNAVGCDSTATLNLTINNSTSGSESITACDSYTWNGSTYTTSGSYAVTLTNAVGCDSTATLNLTINSSTSGSESITACDSYTWNGTTYTTSGSYTATLTNAVGCDSTATLNLTINNSTSGSESMTACDSYTWNGTTYTTSGSYTATLTNAAGCDSTATLNLTINNSTSGSESITACDSYTWNGTTYTTSGSYIATLTNAVGCDSTATLNLTINNSTSGSESITACDSYTWNGITYTISGSYTATLTNAAGCDSTATLNLTINSLDLSVTNDSPTLTANLSGASYQWIDCDNGNIPILGATNQSFTATENGNYAVIVTDLNCSDTSDCYLVDNVGVKTLDNGIIRVYPNPSSGYFTVDYSGTLTEIRLTDMSGRDVQIDVDLENGLVNTINLAPGNYMLVVTTVDKYVHTELLVIQ